MKGKLIKKIIACACSLALAGALVPAMAVSAFAAAGDPVVFTVQAQEIGTDTAKVIKEYTEADLAEITANYPPKYYVMNGTTVYSATKYIELDSLLYEFSQWDDGAYFIPTCYKKGSTTETELYGKCVYSYDMMDENGYFWPGQTGAENEKYTGDGGDVWWNGPVLATTYSSAKLGDGTYSTAVEAGNAASAAEPADGNRIMMGSSYSDLQEGNVTGGFTFCSGVTGLVIYYPHSLSTAKVTAPTLTYNGKTQTVVPTVKDANGKALATSDYVVYGNKVKKAGTYKISVLGKELTDQQIGSSKNKISYKNWNGSKTIKVKVNMKKPGKLKVKSGKKKITVKWAANGATKYKVFYKAQGAKKWTKTKATKATSKTIKKLGTGKKYQVKVVATASGVGSKTFKTVTSKVVK